MRCFVALDLPAPVRNHLAKVADRVGKKGNVKWVPPEQMHLTLVFAGELDPAAADGLRAVVSELEVPAMSLSLSGLGHFPPRGEPRVVWAGVAGDVEAVAALHERLEAGAERLGVPREKRGFVPHVTLGRVRSAFGVFALVKQLEEIGKELNPKPFVPTGLVLYRSELLPGGPIHTPMLRRPVPPGMPAS